MPSQIENYLQALQDLASKSGLHFFGATSLDVAVDFEWYEQWIAEGRHGGMLYLERNLNVRKDPSTLLPGAKSAWVFGLPYYLGDKWQRGRGFEQPRFAMYSRLNDYHKVLRQRLDHISTEFQKQFDDAKNQEFRSVVDSVPLLERALAANTGGGFIGKNTCLIHPKKGSFFLLGEIISTTDFGAKMPPHQRRTASRRSPEGGCGTCKRCQVHCPTGALDQDYRIDARKCLSWWTIENRGTIPKEYWTWIAQYVYGCDICQLVCPWNRGIEVPSTTKALIILPTDLDIYLVATMDQAFYEKTFGGTPATRAKREGLVRNALISLYIRSDPRLIQAIDHLHSETHEAIQGTISMIKHDLAISKICR